MNIYEVSTTELHSLALEILNSRKYQNLGLPEETVADLLRNELAHNKDKKNAIKNTRRKLHNIIAPYLGDLNYDQAQSQLEIAFQSVQSDKIKEFCQFILAQHISSRERLEILENFYQKLFAPISKPRIILDMACALNPFSLPWMNLPYDIQYHAFDIHQPRVQLINRFFKLYGAQPFAEVRDVLLDPPTFHADAAFLFKEAHRMEQRRNGASRDLLQALDVDSLFVSLPTCSLHGKRDLISRMRLLMDIILKGLPWDVQEIAFTNELVFLIQK